MRRLLRRVLCMFGWHVWRPHKYARNLRRCKHCGRHVRCAR